MLAVGSVPSRVLGGFVLIPTLKFITTFGKLM